MIITLALSYYSLRTIHLFKSSVAARAWVYISLSGIFFSLGVGTFLLNDILSIGLFAVGELSTLWEDSSFFSVCGRTSSSGQAKTISLNSSK